MTKKTNISVNTTIHTIRVFIISMRITLWGNL
jgi:hypothetical protein